MLQHKAFVICIASLLLTKALAGRPQIPKSSWEDWLQKIHLGAQDPKRPDSSSLQAPLPTWVDCYLSWQFDHKKLTLPKELVLVTGPKDCRGQLEEWTINK